MIICKQYEFIWMMIVSSNEKRALDNSSALMYNLLRKVIGCISDLPSVE